MFYGVYELNNITFSKKQMNRAFVTRYRSLCLVLCTLYIVHSYRITIYGISTIKWMDPIDNVI